MALQNRTVVLCFEETRLPRIQLHFVEISKCVNIFFDSRTDQLRNLNIDHNCGNGRALYLPLSVELGGKHCTQRILNQSLVDRDRC